MKDSIEEVVKALEYACEWMKSEAAYRDIDIDWFKPYTQAQEALKKFKLQSQQPEIADIELEKLAEDYCKKEEYGYALQPHIIPAFIEGYELASSKLKQRMNILKQQNDVHLLCTIESDKKIEALQQKGNDSDAVELWKEQYQKLSNVANELQEYLFKFPEWATENYVKGGGRQSKYWFDRDGEGVGTTEELYELFKQSKSLHPIQSKL